MVNLLPAVLISGPPNTSKYADKGHPWLACYQPFLKGAVVVAAHNEEIPVGAVVPMQ